MTDQSDDDLIVDLMTISLLAVVHECADIAADQHFGYEAAARIKEQAEEIVKQCLNATAIGIMGQRDG